MKHALTLFLSLTALTLASGTTPAQTKKRAEQKIDIEADHLHVSQDQSKATFSGHVKIEQGDVKIGANKVTAHFGGEDGDFTSVIAEGDVTVIYGETTASGKKAVYDPATSAITLTGDVVLLQKQNALKGSALSYNLETGDINLKGTESGRIKGSFKLK